MFADACAADALAQPALYAAEVARQSGLETLGELLDDVAERCRGLACSPSAGLEEVVCVVNDLQYLEGYRFATDLDGSVKRCLDSMVVAAAVMVDACGRHALALEGGNP